MDPLSAILINACGTIRLGIYEKLVRQLVSCIFFFYKYIYHASTFKEILYETRVRFLQTSDFTNKDIKMKTLSLKYLKVQNNFTCHLIGRKNQTQLQNQIKVEIHLGILFRIYELSKKKARNTYL